MSNIQMNRELGTKWFTFYTKVRPWFAVIAALGIVVEFVQYPGIYFEYWWLLLYLLGGLAAPVLAVMTAIKSGNEYGSFVRFVNAVLIFETINIAYQISVQQYLKSWFNFGTALFTFIIGILLDYFLWYRLNMKYFKKRIVKDTPITPNPEENGTIHHSLSKEEEVPERYGAYNVYGEDIMLTKTPPQTPPSPSVATPEVRFCRKCGAKLIKGSLFCNKCGTRISSDN